MFLSLITSFQYNITHYVIRKIVQVIVSFKDKNLQKFYEGERVVRYQAVSKQLTRRLTILNSATSLQDLAILNSNHLEELLGDRKGQHSIRVNAQWRLCFRWTLDGPSNVEMTDYHK